MLAAAPVMDADPTNFDRFALVVPVTAADLTAVDCVTPVTPFTSDDPIAFYIVPAAAMDFNHVAAVSPFMTADPTDFDRVPAADSVKTTDPTSTFDRLREDTLVPAIAPLVDFGRRLLVATSKLKSELGGLAGSAIS